MNYYGQRTGNCAVAPEDLERIILETSDYQ